MGTHASMLVVDEGRTTAAYGYEHGDGQCFIDDLLRFADDRNKLNSWGNRGSTDELWPVTPAEFVTRWAAQQRAVHERFGRTGAGISTNLDLDPRTELQTEYTHLVVVNGTQVVSVRRVHRSGFGAGSSYTITFDPAPVTDGTEPNAWGDAPSLHQDVTNA